MPYQRKILLKTTVTASPEMLKNVELTIYDALEKAVIRTVELGERVAKRLAPERKVSESIGRASTRALSSLEIKALPASIRKAYTPAQLSSLQTTVRRSKQSLSAPEVSEIEYTGGFRLSNRADESFLNGRGRSELREAGVNASFVPIRQRATAGAKQRLTVVNRGRESAIFAAGIKPSGRAFQSSGASMASRAKRTLGGRLRGEIRYRALERGAAKIVYVLESPTPYARFVEYPTTRTAAQPYMRPARAAMEHALERNVRTELNRVGGKVVL